MAIEQLAPGASTASAHAVTGVDGGNSPAVGPEGRITPVTVSGWFPALVSLTFCDVLEMVPSG
jgi:hypothetical protein